MNNERKGFVKGIAGTFAVLLFIGLAAATTTVTDSTITIGGMTINTTGIYGEYYKIYADATTGGLNVGQNTLTGGDSAVIGYGSTTTGDFSLAAGKECVVAGDGSVAMGYQAKVYDANPSGIEGSVALGNGVNATGTYGAVALGYGTTATGANAMATGYQTEATGAYATAGGYQTKTSGLLSSSWGWGIECGGEVSACFALDDQTGTNVTQDSVFVILGGNVGINETAPSESLVVNGTSLLNSTYITGRAGINTTTPAYGLEVNGTLQADDFYAGDGTQGWTGTINVTNHTSNNCTITVKDGLITGTTC